MADQALIVFCTFPDPDKARTTVKQIVDLRLAACGNILPRVHSIYRWKGKVESGDESLAIFKLPAAKYAALEKKLRELHPYDVPEIISCRIENALPEYLRWVVTSCAI
jgi:periplasmic divalent cation tolerance protein